MDILSLIIDSTIDTCIVERIPELSRWTDGLSWLNDS